MRKPISAALVIGFVCLAPSAAAAASTSPAPRPTASISEKKLTSSQLAALKNKTRTVLYSLTGASGSLKAVPGMKMTYVLDLNGADADSVWFTDRPYRDSGVMPTIEVAKAFAMTRDPANIALVLHTPVGGTDTIVAVMTKSLYNISTKTFTAQLRILSKEATGLAARGLARHIARADSFIPKSFSRASLFIDSQYAGFGPPSAQYPPNPSIGDTYVQEGFGPFFNMFSYTSTGWVLMSNPWG